MKQIVFTLLVSVLLAVGTCHAQLSRLNDHSLQNSNLVVHWETNVGGGPLYAGDKSLVIWPHTKDRRETVRVLANGKLIGSFRGDEIDDSAIEATLLAGRKSYEAPRLGMEGAQRKADRLAKLYQRIGRNVEVQTESIQKVFLIAIGESGVITALDAESGADIWKHQLPNLGQPIFGPAVSDQYVIVVCGPEYLVYELQTGQLLSRRKLVHVPTGPLVAFDRKVGVPSVGGRLVFYDVIDPHMAPQIVRIGGENRIGVALSADQNYLAWPIHDRLVIAKIDKQQVELWTSLKTDSNVPSLPTVTNNGFVMVAHSGMVTKLKNERLVPMVWKSPMGTTASQSAVVGESALGVVSQDGLLFIMDCKTGDLLWDSPVHGIEMVLNMTDTHVYALDSAKNLVTINAKTGKAEARVYVGLRTPIRNSTSNRVLIVDARGMLTCLREPEAFEAKYYTPYQFKPTEEEQEASKEEEPSTPETPSTPDTNPFGTEPMEPESSPFGDAPAESDDPFGGSDSPF